MAFPAPPWVPQAGVVVNQFYLCSKCPKSLPNSNPLTGPYTSSPPAAAVLKWAGTACVA